MTREFGFSELLGRLLGCLLFALTSCGGIVEAIPNSEASSRSDDDSATGSEVPCGCQTGNVIVLNGPDGALTYNETRPAEALCSEDFPSISADSCRRPLFYACAGSGACIFLAETDTGALLQMTDQAGSSLRTISGTEGSVSARVVDEHVQGEFSFDEANGTRYWGSFELCTFQSRDVGERCPGP